jgi:hypothetical protein
MNGEASVVCRLGARNRLADFQTVQETARPLLTGDVSGHRHKRNSHEGD